MAARFALVLIAAAALSAAPGRGQDRSLLRDHLLVTWYGNPRSARMGVLGEETGAARAAALRAQAAAYAPLTRKRVVMAYHLVAVVALCEAGADGLWRRRESHEVVRALLEPSAEPTVLPSIPSMRWRWRPALPNSARARSSRRPRCRGCGSASR